MPRYVLSDETVLPDWGVAVKVNSEGQLMSVPLNCKPIYGVPILQNWMTYYDCEMQPVELVCAHFLHDVNEALGTNFHPDDFPMRSCEGHPICDSEGREFYPKWPK